MSTSARVWTILKVAVVPIVVALIAAASGLITASKPSSTPTPTAPTIQVAAGGIAINGNVEKGATVQTNPTNITSTVKNYINNYFGSREGVVLAPRNDASVLAPLSIPSAAPTVARDPPPPSRTREMPDPETKSTSPSPLKEDESESVTPQNTGKGELYTRLLMEYGHLIHNLIHSATDPRIIWFKFYCPEAVSKGSVARFVSDLNTWKIQSDEKMNNSEGTLFMPAPDQPHAIVEFSSRNLPSGPVERIYFSEFRGRACVENIHGFWKQEPVNLK